MPRPSKHLYAFGEFRLDSVERALFHGSELVCLTPKALETLSALVRRAGHVVSKEELMQEVWPDTFVEEGNLKVNVSVLRKALGEGSNGHAFIETVPRRGYRFIAPVNLLAVGGDDLVVEKTTRARIITEVTDGSPSVWTLTAPALPAPSTVRHQRRLLLVASITVALALIAGARWYLSSRPGAPIRVTLANKKLVAWDARDRMAWEYEFPQAAEFQVVQGQPYALFTDVSGKGHRELLTIVNLRAESPAVSESAGNLPGGYRHSFVYCFSEQGRLLWSYSPDLNLSFSGHVYEGPWSATAMILTPAATGQTTWVAYRHHTWWPSFVARIDAQGGASIAFVNPGNLWVLASVRNSTGNYVLVGGISNALGSAVMAVLGDADPGSAAPQPLAAGSYSYDNWPRAPHLYLMFSPSEIFRLEGAAYHRIQSILVEADRIQVHTYEGKDFTGGSTYLEAYYEFTRDFALTSASMSDSYWQVHAEFEKRHRITHSAKQCPDRSIGSRMREYTSAGAWLAPGAALDRPAN